MPRKPGSVTRAEARAAAAAVKARREAPQPALPQHTLVEVTWLDATFDLDKEVDACILRTLGFLIVYTPEKIVIASEGNLGDRYFRAFTTIPAGMILAVRRLLPV